MDEKVIWEKFGHVRVVTYNNPEKMNAMSLEMMQLDEKYLDEFVADNDAWVLVYTGNGRALSVGMDLTDADRLMALPRQPRNLVTIAGSISKPIICAIGGYAIGAGCELSLACDIRIAADDARIGLPEVKRSIVAGGGGCQRLPRAIALGDALMMLLTGDWINAQEAYRIGLVQKVVPRDKLKDEAIALAQKICENGPVAVRLTKEAVYRSLDIPLNLEVAHREVYNLRCKQLAPNDLNEGLKAFFEKRPAVYTGK
jgi:enoyl-CoA hydratase/carnithine racemase